MHEWWKGVILRLLLLIVSNLAFFVALYGHFLPEQLPKREILLHSVQSKSTLQMAETIVYGICNHLYLLVSIARIHRKRTLYRLSLTTGRYYG